VSRLKETKEIGIIAFAFGVPETIRSNLRIAEIASQKAQELNAPVYTQFDVYLWPGVEVEYTHEKPGSPPPTLRIARGAVQWARQRGFRQLWVVATKPHLWRALRDVKEAVREAREEVEVHVCEEIEKFPEDEWFCHDSTQKHTQSRKVWDKRERILKSMPFFLYKRVAS